MICPNDTRALAVWETLSQAERQALAPSGLPVEADHEWAQWLARLPVDAQELERSARRYLAFERARAVRSAADLLRVTLAYCLCPTWSYRLLAAWALILGLAQVTHTALRTRLKRTRRWLGYLVGVQLQLQRLATELPRVRLRLVDATTLQQPGSTGTDWRLHVTFDLAQATVASLELTAGSEGETLARHGAEPGDILMGDRAYARRPGIVSALARGAQVLVRWHFQVCPLETAAGERFAVLPWLRDHEAAGAGSGPWDTWLWLRYPEQARARAQAQAQPTCYRIHLVAQHLPPEAAQAAVRRLRRKAQKQGRTPSAESLKAAEYVLLVTSLPAMPWTAERVLRLYRWRWQVELFFKRTKSLLDLGRVRAHRDPDLAQVEILGKLLVVLLLGAWPAPTVWADGRGPRGQDVRRPLSPWRWLQLGLETLRTVVRGALTVQRCLAVLPQLARALCDTPRRRASQLALAQHWLARLGVALLAGEPFLELPAGQADCTV